MSTNPAADFIARSQAAQHAVDGILAEAAANAARNADPGIPAGTAWVDYLTAQNDRDGVPRRLFVAHAADGTVLAVAPERFAWIDSAPWVRPCYEAPGVGWHTRTMTLTEWRTLLALRPSLRTVTVYVAAWDVVGVGGFEWDLNMTGILARVRSIDDPTTRVYAVQLPADVVRIERDERDEEVTAYLDRLGWSDGNDYARTSRATAVG
jgi:hypothetical protein